MALRGRPLVACLLLAVIGAGAAAADFRDEYRAGIEAYERRDWSETVRRMDRAIAENPEASGGLRRYTPHLYRGIALAELGRCREAIAALDESERQGKVPDRERSALVAKRTACRDLVRRVESAATAAQEVVDAASAAAFAVAQDQSEPVLTAIWQDGNPSFSVRESEAGRLLARSRSGLQQAADALDLEGIAAARATAQQAREQLEQLHGEATARLAELGERVADELAAVATAAETARRDLRYVVANFSPLPPTVADEVAGLQEAVDEAAAANRATTLDELGEIQTRLRTRLAALRRAVRFPPDALQAAAGEFFAGRYQEAVDLLAEPGRDPRAIAHACLLHAASLHALARLAGPAAEEQLAAAREQLATCSRLPVRVEPLERYFAPSFRAEWTAAMAAPAAD